MSLELEHLSPADSSKFSEEFVPEQISTQELSTTQILRHCSFWGGYNFSWFLISIVLVPEMILEIMGDDHKGAGLSIVSLTAGAVTLFLSPVIGAVNDGFTSSRFGKRAPWIMIGAIGMAIFSFTLNGKNSLFTYTLCYMGLTIFAMLASVPFNGLIADIGGSQKGKV